MSWERFKSNYAQKQKEAYEWQAFHSKFMELAHEEQGQAVVVTKGALLRRMDQLLCACSYRKHPEGWEMGKPEQGLVSLLDTPPHGVWNYCSNGVSENFRERVRQTRTTRTRKISGFTGSTSIYLKTIAISFCQYPRRAE